MPTPHNTEQHCALAPLDTTEHGPATHSAEAVANKLPGGDATSVNVENGAPGVHDRRNLIMPARATVTPAVDLVPSTTTTVTTTITRIPIS
jgi:hypothetical protein